MRSLNQELSSPIDILRSLKFMFSCLVILDHTGVLFAAAPLWNLAYLESVSEYVDQRCQGLL
jgi:hypothetical protein